MIKFNLKLTEQDVLFVVEIGMSKLKMEENVVGLYGLGNSCETED